MKRLLDSIVIQSFRDFIVIITDDSDGDLIEELIYEYSGINIQYHRNHMRLGAAANTNEALKLAGKTDADYVKIMYHDDYFSSSDSLGKMVDALDSNKDACIAFSNTYEIGENINYERKVSDGQIGQLRESRFNLAYANIIGAPSAVIVKKNDLLIDERLVWFLDIEWYMRILGRHENFVFIDEPLITIGRSDTQLTHECINDPALILDENIYMYGKYRELRCEKYVNLMLEQAEKVISCCKLYQICMKKVNVYIYGAGEIGKMCAQFLNRNNISYEAFVVSDGKRQFTNMCGHNVLELNEYLALAEKEKSAVILALNEHNRAEVVSVLEKAGVAYIVWR